MTILNLTPHVINVHTPDGVVDIPTTGTVARLASTPPEPCGEVAGIPVVRMRTGDPVDLPEPVEGAFLVVSTMVRAACPDRTDLLSPGPLVRDSEGRPVGCDGLVCN